MISSVCSACGHGMTQKQLTSHTNAVGLCPEWIWCLDRIEECVEYDQWGCGGKLIYVEGADFG